MNTYKLKITFTALLFALIFPFGAHAYETTQQTATLVAPNTILYTITYKFGFLNRETRMSILATPEQDEFNSPVTRYGFFSNNTEISNGTSNALVLTDDEDVEIRDGQYYLPKGRSAEFTLMGIYTLPAENTNLTDTAVMKITELPFTMIDGDKETVGFVTPEELAEYQTPTIHQESKPVTIKASIELITTK